MNIWKELRTRLAIGQAFETWSVTGRVRKTPFRIPELNDDSIAVAGPGIKGQRAIPRSDFEKLSADWSRYINGELRRKEIGIWCKHSSYVLTILHWVQPDQTSA
jgi:hypothetical protein